MSEEEKEVIEDIDLFVHCLNYGEQKITIASERQKEIAQELQVLLNLIKKRDNKIKFLLDNEKSLKEMNRNQMKIIDKQQKEIEELKKPKYLVHFEDNKITKIELINNDFISKDKIREKLDYQYMLWNTPNRQTEYNQEVVDILEELLEEN